MSDFWVRKMKTYFNRIDFDKDGSITKSDFEAMGDRFVKAEKLDAAAGEVMRTKLIQIWDSYISKIGGGASALNEADFIAAMASLVKDSASRDTLAGPLPLFFQAVDANNDGMIDADEFGLFFEIFGLDRATAPASFQAIDENNDGLLSSEEFITAGTEFFTADNPASANKLFWGPLV